MKRNNDKQGWNLHIKQVFIMLALILILLRLNTIVHANVSNENDALQLKDIILRVASYDGMVYALLNLFLYYYLVENRVKVLFIRVAVDPLYFVRLYKKSDERIKTKLFNKIVYIMTISFYIWLFGALFILWDMLAR